jgi:hypothetical protein
MEPTLIANQKISFKEIRVKVIQKNVFSCPVFASWSLFSEIWLCMSYVMYGVWRDRHI